MDRFFFGQSFLAKYFVRFFQVRAEFFDHFALFSGLYREPSEFRAHQLFPIASRPHGSGARHTLRIHLARMENLDGQYANQQSRSGSYDPAKPEA